MLWRILTTSHRLTLNNCIFCACHKMFCVGSADGLVYIRNFVWSRLRNVVKSIEERRSKFIDRLLDCISFMDLFLVRLM